MEYKDYYKIMGLSKDASQEEIKRTYRKLARKYHPDVSKEKDAEEKFKEVGEAYEVLKDPEKRAAYDQLSAAGWQAGQTGFEPPPDWNAGFEFHGGGSGGNTFGDADFSDFFENLFGQAGAIHQYNASGHGRSAYQARGRDTHAKVFIDIEDAYRGASRSLTIKSTVLDKNGHPELKNRTLNVKIPKGVKQGQYIRLQGQGSVGTGGGSSGDLYLEIEFNPHSHYQVDGSDVTLELPITPWEAALGSKINLPTPGGNVELKIPEGSSSGKRMRLKGRGIPSKSPGDFYVILEIAMPEQLSDKEKSLYQELQKASSNFNPRYKLGGIR